MAITQQKYLNEAEISKLNRDLKLCSLRDRVLLGLLMSLGMRGAEALEIKISDVNFSEGIIFVPGKKRSRSRVCPIPENLKRDLEKYVAGLNVKKQTQLFSLSASGLKLIWNRVRPVKGKGIHSLRHTFAIELYKKTRDIKLVQTCLGHKSITSTQVYADFVYSSEEIRKALIGGLYYG